MTKSATLAPALNAEAQTQAYLATIPADVNARSISYTDGGHWLILWGLIISALLTWIIVRSNILVRVRNWVSANRPRPLLASAAVGATFVVMSWVLDLPWETYTGWWREKSYGLTKQPFGDWFGQALLGFAISLIIISLVLVGIYALIRKFPNRWWLLGGGASAVFIVVMQLIAPIYIMPLFNEYKPFPKGNVRDEIVKLAEANGVPADKVFIYDGSRQRDVVTANVAGIFGSARIAVSDIAVKRANLSEVRVVVGHEIGHYALGHSLRSAFFFAGLMILGFYAVHRLFPFGVKLFGGHNITGITDPAGLPMLSFIIGLVLTLATPLTNSMTRIGETEADNFSLRTARDPDGLAAALIKTVEYRKASPGKLEEIIFHTHPSVENRVRNAMEWKVAQK